MVQEDRIRQYILTELLYDRDLPGLADDEPLIGNGYLDSMGIMVLVLWLEDAFGIKIEDEEVVPERLETIHAIASWTREKLAAPAQ